MASTYTPLGVELQATGENAGTWGTKTNTNLQILEQISGGFTQKSIAGGAQTTALTVSDGSTGAELVAVNLNNSAPLVSKIDVPIAGDVNVLFVKVCVPVNVTSPLPKLKVTISGLVPSLADAKINLSPLSVEEKVRVSPEPDAYLN